MTQSHLLIETLRRFLKLKGIKYRDLAERTGQTEANVKRIFSQKTLPLQLLEKMCIAAGTDLFELARQSAVGQTEIGIFSEAQEKALADDPKLFVFLYLLLAGYSIRRVESRYHYDPRETQRYLLKLDALGLIRLGEKNAYQVLISKNIRWIEDGPLNARYREQISDEFMNADFRRPDERLRFLSARLSREALHVISRRVEKLIAEFTEFAEVDKNAALENSVPLWLVIAYRPWEFSISKQYRRT